MITTITTYLLHIHYILTTLNYFVVIVVIRINMITTKYIIYNFLIINIL